MTDPRHKKPRLTQEQLEALVSKHGLKPIGEDEEWIRPFMRQLLSEKSREEKLQHYVNIRYPKPAARAANGKRRPQYQSVSYISDSLRSSCSVLRDIEYQKHPPQQFTVFDYKLRRYVAVSPNTWLRAFGPSRSNMIPV